MTPLPPMLLARLRDAPPLVVAPVGLGFAQEALAAWAEEQGRLVLHEPGPLLEPCLYLPKRRRDLARLAGGWTPEGALFLEEADLLYSLDEWQGALPNLPRALADSLFEACEGWPEGLRLAKGAGVTSLPLHRHPLVLAHLERFLPKDDARETLQRAAIAPLLLPELYEPLGLTSSEVEGLSDAGFFYPKGAGLALPKLLRRALAPAPDAALASRLAEVYTGRKLFAEALEVLADAELWGAYLTRLAEGFDPQAGEMRLRHYLQRLPRTVHDHASYRYLVGLLERLRGEFERAQACYAEAITAASPALAARIENARGVTFALQGKLEEALGAFGVAAQGATGARLSGEARHNRGGVLLQLQRYLEAEEELRAAVTLFREGGEYVREARSLQLLALSYHQRGLLKEAQRGYAEVLELLTMLGQPTALVRTNLAEAFIYSGESDSALVQLDKASREASGARLRGYVEVNRALWQLTQGQPDAARALLAGLLAQELADAHLQAEAHLLLARLNRLAGQPEEASQHAQAAQPLGLRAALELALCKEASLDGIIAQARLEEARLELATALLHRGRDEDLREALALIQAHGYLTLLEDAQHAPKLAALAQDDPSLQALFPLRLDTFAAFSVRFLGKSYALADFPTRKSAALLLRLALSSYPLPRESLAEAFWGDAGNPLQSLQTALYHLNRTLGVQLIASQRGSLRLLYPVRLDLARFEKSAKEALSADAGAVRRALELATGDILPDFPEWFEEERRSAEAQRVRLLRRLVELTAPEPAKAAEALEALLKQDPYDFESRERLIGLYTALGEAELARRETERLELLAREL